MRSAAPISYTESEVRSYLPSGWHLAGHPEGSWDSREKSWRVEVRDNVDFDWPVVVGADDAVSLGRIEALRQAFDRVYRERLG